MIAAIRHLFRRKSLTEIVAAELADAQFDLLKAQTAKEYASCVVAFNQVQIARLRAVLREQEAEK